MAVWKLSSLAALERLRAQPTVRAIHEDAPLHAVSVSNLGFINQPQTAAEGVLGAGTVVAVIDGGLGSNYLSYADFGTCTDVNTPSTACRVLYNHDYYPGSVVTCIASRLANGGNITFTINVQWNTSGAVYDTATLQADQNNSAAPSQQQLAFGSLPISDVGDAPLPLWCYLLLGLALTLTPSRKRERGPEAFLLSSHLSRSPGEVAALAAGEGELDRDIRQCACGERCRRASPHH